MKALFTFAMFLLPAILSSPVGAEQYRRLPAGFHQGRCLYVVDDKQRIAGKCFYSISKGGGFHIDGPRQVSDGIDYPKAKGMADMESRDWWADVFPDDGGWSGYGNEAIADVHGGRLWTLHRQGACFMGEGVKVCLWRD